MSSSQPILRFSAHGKKLWVNAQEAKNAELRNNLNIYHGKGHTLHSRYRTHKHWAQAECHGCAFDLILENVLIFR